MGRDHDTATGAVERIRRWWQQAGKQRDPQAQRLLITADGGGSTGSRVRVWQWAVQRLADETGRSIRVCHVPPGTRQGNKVEHRLFAFISQNWRGQPLVSSAVILSLIAAPTTATGLTVESFLDTQIYPAGIQVTDEEMATIQLEREAFHGEWNDTISPHLA